MFGKIEIRRVAFSANSEMRHSTAPLLLLRLIEAEVRLRRIKCSDIACVVVVVVDVVVDVVFVVVAVVVLPLAASMNGKKATIVHSR